MGGEGRREGRNRVKKRRRVRFGGFNSENWVSNLFLKIFFFFCDKSVFKNNVQRGKLGGMRERIKEREGGEGGRDLPTRKHFEIP